MTSLIGNRCANGSRERNDAGPGIERIVFIVVNRRARTDFRRRLADGQFKDGRRLKFLFVRKARFRPASGKDVFRQQAESLEVFLRVAHDLAVPSTTTER